MMIYNSLFKPSWWLNHSHLQTIYPSLCRKISAPSIVFRERLTTPDNDFIDIDWCGQNSSSPLVILLHGLSGSSKSSYIKGLQQQLSKQGFRSVALNFRGCSGQANHLARCYHSGETEDIDFLYRLLRQREPNTKFAAVGFSLGGNVLLKWLGEQRDKIDLSAAVAVSVPLVLSLCANRLDQGFSKLYRFSLLRELKQYVTDKLTTLENIGRLEEVEKIKQLGDLSKIKSFWEYDDRVVAKLHGFKDVHDYYQRSSSRQFLKSIQVPSLILQALDDPFMTADVIPEGDELSPYVVLELSEHGGHVGFVSGNNPFKAEYWLEQRILSFLHQMIAND